MAMNLRRIKLLRWIPVVLGAAGLITPILLELGWVPERHATDAIITLLGFLVLDSGLRELRGSTVTPEAVHGTEDFISIGTGFARSAEREMLIIEEMITPVEFGELSQAYRRYPDAVARRVRENKLIHVYVIVIGQLHKATERAFEFSMGLERDASLEGRIHVRYVESPISFSVSVFDQRHWVISFAPNPNDPRGAALVFRDNEEGARRVAEFIRHRWWEDPSVSMSLTEAYEKWKLYQQTAAKAVENTRSP
jgi:hypothetical protein